MHINNVIFLILSKNAYTKYSEEPIKLGIPKYYASKWGYGKAYWRVAGSPVLTRSITNERLAQAGFYSLSDRYESLHICD